ncbi:metallophosphoesterase family protein [Lentisphaera profundi]|uniref:Metallophosphoesterase family protein n=1 Tax=Lentisphaera profundi TaxID=1658616 RepID=A0ABY7VW53_9BACT|nr:metallophosphoesterase [Lentisphaera profundi]WDE98312.1 metallophosphoesterase family protein [Lentisphaera profundi]
MRYAIVTDIHANWQSWSVTLKDIRKRGVDSILCLGDVVGYGPSPVRVLESTYENCDGFILGNHDAVIGNRLDSDLFNDHAKYIIEWTREQMSSQAVDLFANMSLRMEGPGFECAHAELAVPGRFGYIYQTEDSLESFSSTQSPLMFVGHTHLPGYFQCDVARGEVKKCDPRKFKIQEGFRYLVNAGSTGDPRDGSLTSSYVIYDAVKQTVEFCYVPFDVEAYKQEVLKASIPARNYFLQLYSGQIEETETLRDMRISTEGMTTELKRKPVKVTFNSTKRKNVNFNNVDPRRSAQRVASSKNLEEEGSRRRIQPKDTGAKKINVILLIAGGGSVFLIIISLVIFFMGGDDKRPVEMAAQENAPDKKVESKQYNVSTQPSLENEKVESLDFVKREIPHDQQVHGKNGWDVISDFDTMKEGWLMHSPRYRKVIFRSEEIHQNYLGNAKFRSYDFLHTYLVSDQDKSPFRIYSPAFLLNKDFLHFQKDYRGESIKLYLLKDGSTTVESVIPYGEDQKAVAIINVKDFKKERVRLLIDGNKIEKDDYLQIDNLGQSTGQSSHLLRRPLSAETKDGRIFVSSLLQGNPGDSIKNLDELGKDLFGVNAKLLRGQVAELGVIYNEVLDFLKGKVGKKIDLQLAGMKTPQKLEIKQGKNEDIFQVEIDGRSYAFYPFELHPVYLSQIVTQEHQVLELIKKYQSCNDFYTSEDFPAHKLYNKFNFTIFANKIKIQSKKLNDTVSISVNASEGQAVFKAENKPEIKISLPYLMPVKSIDLDELNFGKVLTLSRNSKQLWQGVGEENSFIIHAYNSYIMGQDISAYASIDGERLSSMDLLNLNKSFQSDTAFSISFDKPTQADYIRILFWSPVGLEDDSTFYLKVRHKEEGMTRGNLTFQGILRPYKGLNYITLALPSDKLKSIDLEFELSELMVIRSVKILRTK